MNSGGMCATGNFDNAGNTSAFGIPAPLIGNIGQGGAMYGLSCNGCHTGESSHGQGMTFAQLKSSVTGPKMRIASISDQQYANMTAYLNRPLHTYLQWACITSCAI